MQTSTCIFQKSNCLHVTSVLFTDAELLEKDSVRHLLLLLLLHYFAVDFFCFLLLWNCIHNELHIIHIGVPSSSFKANLVSTYTSVVQSINR